MTETLQAIIYGGEEQHCIDYAERSGLEVAHALCSSNNTKNVAFEMLAQHEADVLIVAKLESICDSIHDLALWLRVAQHQGWCLIVTELGLDTTTPIGRLQAGIVVQLAEFERRRICNHQIPDPFTSKPTWAYEFGHIFCPKCGKKL